MENSERDIIRMEEALQLARKGEGTTSPNPPVGAVIYQNNRCIGRGFHEKAGLPHAERRAIQDALEHGYADDLEGADLYVTLEPCSSFGRTPPCTQAILDSGISRVVYGMDDPDARHRGRAKEILEAGGVQVCAGVHADACRAFLQPWVHSVLHGLPWVVVKVACTLDGRMARRSERWISCEESRRFAHELRLKSDGILVGGQTLRRDNPALTIRSSLSPIPPCKVQPWRFILTRNKSLLPSNATVFTDEHAARSVVLERIDDFEAMLRMLHTKYGVVRLMLECGGSLLRTFLEHDLVREWVQIVAPILCGGSEQLVPGTFLPREAHLRHLSVQSCGPDQILRGTLHYESVEPPP